MNWFKTAAALGVCSCASLPALADAHWLVGIGATEVLDENHDLFGTLERRAPWHERPVDWLATVKFSDDTLYAGAGVYRDFELGAGWVLTPSFTPGLYTSEDKSDLGHSIEFRSMLELSWRGPRFGVGLSFAHLSNAGLGDRNPGTETLTLVVIVPGA